MKESRYLLLMYVVKVLYDIEEASGDVEAFRIDATADGRGIISVVEGRRSARLSFIVATFSKLYFRVEGLQGYPSALRLCFVDSEFIIPPLLPSRYAHSAAFPLAQAVSGRLRNISVISTQNPWQNLGLRADG